MLVLVINRSLSFVLEYPYGSVCAITVPLTFKGRRSIKGQEVYPNYLSQFFSLSSLDIWQWQWQRAPCMGGNLRIWKDTSKLSAARCCPMEGHQLLNATFFDPCLNLCLDQAGIKNTISQTSYLSFFLHTDFFHTSTPPAKKTEPSNLVLRAQDHKKNPKFKGWQWDLKNPKFKIRSSKERRTKSEITEIVVEKYVFKIPKIQNFRNTRNQ